jgi:hypothetical protein
MDPTQAPPPCSTPTFRRPRAPRRPIPSRRRKYAAYKELSQRVERHAALDKLAARLDAGKAVMTGRGRKRKVTPATADAPAAFRWKRERKR